MTVEVRTLSGAAIKQNLASLAELRIEVFAAYPYLYDGDAAYETRYLHEFAAATDSVLIAAFANDGIVGVATASPMWTQKAEFRLPFEQVGIDTSKLFYFGESVLLPQYRGQGIGHSFFDQREAAARDSGARAAAFAAVIRPENHPAKPTDYRPLDSFWKKRGYRKVDGLVSELAWKEFGEAQESAKKMQYWMRAL
jgi:GNAT superfamily N-acetyltransferase